MNRIHLLLAAASLCATLSVAVAFDCTHVQTSIGGVPCWCEGGSCEDGALMWYDYDCGGDCPSCKACQESDTETDSLLDHIAVTCTSDAFGGTDCDSNSDCTVDDQTDSFMDYPACECQTSIIVV